MGRPSELTICHVNLARGFRGGERQTELLIKNLSLLNVSQYLILRNASPLQERLEGTDNLKIIAAKKFCDPRFSGHLAIGNRVFLVHAHEARAAQWALIHFLTYKVPFIITRRVPEPVRNNFFNRALYNKAAAVAAISSAIADTLKKQFDRDIFLIPSSCSNLSVNKDSLRKLHHQFADDFVVGHIGALVDRHKGQSVIIKAASFLKKQIPNLKLVFVGSGSDELMLKEQAKALNLEQITLFTGFVDNVADYINSFDVFVYPSNYEGLGSVILDVMEQGVPVVATNVDGIPDIVKHNHNGILIEKQDDKALANAVLKIRDDKVFRQQIISGAVKTAADHSPRIMASSYKNLYERLTAK